MRCLPRVALLTMLVLLACHAFAAAQQPRKAESWQRGYAGSDASGAHVLAYWRFAAGKESADASRHGHSLTWEGAEARDQGRFDGCLESFPGWPVADKPHRALAAHHPALSPRGAFTVEMWIKPKPEFETIGQCYLLDKKYVAHADYQLLLSAAQGKQRRLIVNLGFGVDSATFLSDPGEFPAGEWRHLAFAYDGNGTVQFFRDGASLGRAQHAGRGPTAGGGNRLSIGDRLGSHYGGFPGFIDEVRLCEGALEFRPALISAELERTAFVRMEAPPQLALTVHNLQGEPLSGAKLSLSAPGHVVHEEDLPEIAPASSHAVHWTFDTSLRPDEYPLEARLTLPREPIYATNEQITLRLVPRPLPHRLPVVMWGLASPQAVLENLPRLKDLGFTHSLGFGADYGAIWKAGEPIIADSAPRVADVKRMLDTALAHDLRVVASLSPAKSLQSRPELQRIDRSGKPYARHDVCAASPGLPEFCFNVGASVAQTYGAFPAFQAAMAHTEVRDDSQLCFHDHDRAAYREFAGGEIPAEALIKNGVQHSALPGFPRDRVVPDDHPLLVYYRWFWQQGDGWNRLHTELTRGLKSTGRDDLWTFYDPAVRVPSVSGSGGGVDVLSHWSYTYPDPIRIGLATDQLFAMARNAPQPQQVMKMTQIIWYRSQTAPIGKAPRDAVTSADRPASVWEDRDPDAAYITIAPQFLRSALWSKLARPIQGIMYHGWQSLVPNEGASAYRFTHPDTRHELRRLIREVVEPLGPTLLQLPDRPADVAVLESFASQMFARRGGYGYNGGWGGDAWHVLQYAHLPAEILYEEDVLRRGLDGYRVLALFDCDVLPASVVERIRAFQSRGGVVLGDERLAPAIKPDLVVPVYTRTRKADEDKAALLSRAADLRRALEGRYLWHADASDPDVIPRCRAFGAADYLFLVNDRREFGDYVGQHGMVMEQGLPATAVASIRRRAGHVYDLTAHRPIPAEQGDDALAWTVELGPCEGRLYLITEQPISQVDLTAPESARRGESISCEAAIVDPQGRPIDAVLPVQVEVVDPNGRRAERSGYYGAAGGKLQLTLDLAGNDVRGVWQIRVRELASGQEAVAYFRVGR